MEITKVQNKSFEKGSEQMKGSAGADFMEVFSQKLSVSKEKQKRTESNSPKTDSASGVPKDSGSKPTDEAAGKTGQLNAEEVQREDNSESVTSDEVYTEGENEEVQASEKTEETDQESGEQKQEDVPAVLNEELAALMWADVPAKQTEVNADPETSQDVVQKAGLEEKISSEAIHTMQQKPSAEESIGGQVIQPKQVPEGETQKSEGVSQTIGQNTVLSKNTAESSAAAGQAAKEQEPQEEQGKSQGQEDSGQWKDQAEFLKQMGTRQAGRKEIPAEEQKTVDFEELQKQVDSSIFWDAGQAVAKNVGGNQGMQYFTAPKSELPATVENQIKSGLEQGMQKGLQLFTIKIQPEGLGEVIVHLASAGGRLSMSIGVTNAETQKMLQSEMVQLKELLRPMNAEVKEVYQSQPDGFDMMNYQQAFYQQQRQQYYAKMQKVHRQFQSDMPEDIQGTPETATKAVRYAGEGLNAYV